MKKAFLNPLVQRIPDSYRANNGSSQSTSPPPLPQFCYPAILHERENHIL